MDIIQPIIKWVGGKTQILEEVLDKFPCDIENYYEPFLGGGVSAYLKGVPRIFSPAVPPV